MKCTIQQLKNYLFSSVYDVYDVFKQYYKEENVDLQGLPADEQLSDKVKQVIPDFNDKEEFDYSENVLNRIQLDLYNFIPTILIHWDNVLVRNEYDRAVMIWDLYAKIPLYRDGKLYRSFTLCRATYNTKQFKDHYAHSHLPSISYSNLAEFLPPCLGTGPINKTIGTLRNSNFDAIIWMLFCEELNRYVHTESIKGGPYHRLEEIGMRGYDEQLNTFIPNKYRVRNIDQANAVKSFISYYLKNGHLKFRYFNGAYTIGMSYYDYIIDISNSFIEYYNTTLYKDLKVYEISSLIEEVIVKNHKFFSCSNISNDFDDFSQYNNLPLFLFKGKMVNLKIKDVEKNATCESHTVTVLNSSVAMYILQFILLTVNFKYKNEYYKESNNSGDVTKTYKDAFYLFQL